MLILFLFIFITFSPTLYSMEKSQKTLPISFSPNNIYAYRDKINEAKKSNDCLEMAKSVKACLPPDIIKAHIAPHFIKPLSTKYKHRLIAYKACNACFATKPIDYYNQWHHVINHDGTYHAVPQIKDEYITWDSISLKRRHTIKLTPNDNNKNTIERIFTKNKKNLHYTLSVPPHYNEEEEKKTLLLIKHQKNNCNLVTPINGGSKFTHYLFSNDCKLIAIGECKESYNLNIYDIKFPRLKAFSLDGHISTLCAAHKSQTFVAGSNNFYNTDFAIHVIMRNKQITYSKSHRSPIICAEFSPDDTRLLTCSHDETTNNSQLILWNTKDLNNIFSIRNIQYNEQTLKAFFICNGQRIITINTNGHIGLLNGLTGTEYNKYYHLWSKKNVLHSKEITPLCIGSNKHQLFINTFKKNIRIRKSTTGKNIAQNIKLEQTPVGMGLTADENAIIFIDEKEDVYHFSLYDQQDCNEIDFIETQANIVQLYELWDIYSQDKKDNKNTAKSSNKKTSTEKIKSYIQDQLKNKT